MTLDRITQYVLGQLSSAEQTAVEAEAAIRPDLREAIDSMQRRLEHLVLERAIVPPAGIRERILESIAKEGRTARPPIIHPASKVSDYAHWLDRPEMVRPEDAEDIYFVPFAENEDGQSALVWLTTGSAEETHTDSIEKFLIVEGACEVSFNNVVHALKAGDVLSIPLHTPHTVKVTSTIPCKIILQRIAA